MKQLNAAMQAKQRRALWEEEEQRRRSADITVPLSPKPSDKTLIKKPQVIEKRTTVRQTDQRSKLKESPVSRHHELWKEGVYCRKEQSTLDQGEYKQIASRLQTLFQSRF